MKRIIISMPNFIGDSINTNSVFDFTKKINKDITLYAKWYEGEPEQVAYNVTFLVDMELYQVLEVPENDTMIEPEAPEKEGYTFVGWYENEVLFDFSKPIKITLEFDGIDSIPLEAEFQSS